jgi:restriction system protein
MLVGEAYRLRGFKVEETGGGGADGGVDLILRKASERTLVQCRQWKAQRVCVSVFRELFGVMAATGAATCIVVTSGRFTDDAKAFAKGRNLELVEGSHLLVLIKSAEASLRNRSSHPKVSQSTLAPSQQTPQAQISTPVAATTSISCPACQSAMVPRKARRGPNAGKAFWGDQVLVSHPHGEALRPAARDVRQHQTVHEVAICLRAPQCSTISTSKKPGAGSRPSANVRTGMLRRIAPLTPFRRLL